MRLPYKKELKNLKRRIVGSPQQREFLLMSKYASGCQFIVETGSGQMSTKYFSRIGSKGATVYSIDLRTPTVRHPHVNYVEGWSITYDDLVMSGIHDIGEYKKRWESSIANGVGGDLDGLVVMEGPQHMNGEVDLIRKVLSQHSKPLDFFFSDSGEFSGLAEWNVVKEKIVVGGYFAAHDIFYPKSVKSFKTFAEIISAENWALCELSTESRQGLLIAQRTK